MCLMPGLAAAQEPWAEPIVTNGPSENRLDLVILGDGYREEDQDLFSSDAQAFADSVLALAPWTEYAEVVNITAVHVVSVDNGGDDGSYGETRDTALGARYKCRGVDRLICIDSSAAYAAAATAAPLWDQLVVLVNDPKYGGSGGAIAVASTHSNSGQIVLHELGHSLFGLADEYESAFPGYPRCVTECREPNVALQVDRGSLKWVDWVDAETPLPTPETDPYLDAVGAFEGARYLNAGVYRPEHNCLMRSLGVPLCAVCRESHVHTFYAHHHPIDVASPADEEVLLEAGEMSFSIARVRPEAPDVEVSWFLDGALIASNVDEVTLNAADLAPGGHQLRVEVVDNTPLVRTDPSDLLRAENAWAVRLPCPADTCDADGPCVVENAPHPDDDCLICSPESTEPWATAPSCAPDEAPEVPDGPADSPADAPQDAGDGPSDPTTDGQDASDAMTDVPHDPDATDSGVDAGDVGQSTDPTDSSGDAADQEVDQADGGQDADDQAVDQADTVDVSDDRAVDQADTVDVSDDRGFDQADAADDASDQSVDASDAGDLLDQSADAPDDGTDQSDSPADAGSSDTGDGDSDTQDADHELDLRNDLDRPDTSPDARPDARPDANDTAQADDGGEAPDGSDSGERPDAEPGDDAVDGPIDVTDDGADTEFEGDAVSVDDGQGDDASDDTGTPPDALDSGPSEGATEVTLGPPPRAPRTGCAAVGGRGGVGWLSLLAMVLMGVIVRRRP